MTTVEKKSNLIFDVGLHKGEDSRFYLLKGFDVVAFEANPDLIREVKKELKEYIDSGQLKIVEGAIVDRKTLDEGVKKISFYMNEDESVWGTIHKEWADRNERMGTASSLIEVDTVDFAKAIKEHGMPHFLKIDIEGADIVCLEELKQFSVQPDYLSIESDKLSFENIKTEIDIMTSLGFDSFKAVQQAGIIEDHIPPKPAREGKYVDFTFERDASGLFGAEVPGEWQSEEKILKLYKIIIRSYKMLGDDGWMNKWNFPGAGRIRNLVRSIFRMYTKTHVPGWYDTHAKHSSVRS